MQRYSLNYYLKKKYGEKIYKIALSGGYTCPNRDGKVGKGGCIFCSSGGSGDFACNDINDAISKLDKKNAGKRYIAYYQNYSVTYNEPEKIKTLVQPALERDDIVAISLATRPDCLDKGILDVLDAINQQKTLWIELGLQTSNEKTAKLINRCYQNHEFEKAVRELRSRNIEVIVHLIIGLPGEKLTDMIESVKYINRYDIQGVKFQLLHVLEDTELAKMYEGGRCTFLSLEEYITILCRCINELREDIIIHRLTGDGPKSILIAPKWSGNKKNVLNSIRKQFVACDIQYK